MCGQNYQLHYKINTKYTFGMRNLKNKGNIGKVKYFLPGPREGDLPFKSKQSLPVNSRQANKSLPHCPDEDEISFQILAINENMNSNIEIGNKTGEKCVRPSKVNISRALKQIEKKGSSVHDKQNCPEESLSFQKLVAINKEPIRYPEGKQKQEFLRFVEQLKHDTNYQNTVTMFTIMYFYQHRLKK